MPQNKQQQFNNEKDNNMKTVSHIPNNFSINYKEETVRIIEAFLYLLTILIWNPLKLPIICQNHFVFGYF